MKDATTDILLQLRLLAESHRDETERLGHPSASAIAGLKAAGCVRFFVPPRFGGAGGTLAQALEWLTALAEGSGSIAWFTMVAMQSPFLMSLFPPETIQSMYGDGPDVILASSSICAGREIVGAGGATVSGVWPLVTGAECCDLFMGHVQTAAGEPPAKRGVLVRPGNFRARREERLLGLVGSSTIHMEVLPHAVHALDTFEVGRATSHFSDVAEFRIPIRVHFALHMAAIAIGIGRAATRWFLDDARASGEGGKRLGEVASRRAVLGACSAELELLTHALRDLAVRAIRSVEGAAGSTAWTERESLAVHAVATHIGAACLRIVASMWSHSGSRVLNERSPFQVCLRDLETLTRHANLSNGIFSALGECAWTGDDALPAVRAS